VVNPRVTLTTATSRGLVLDLVRNRGPISRVQIADLTGLTQATISKIVRALLADGIVAETGEREYTGGKPRVMLQINPTARYAVGVQLGADSITYVVTDVNGAIVGRMRTRGARDAPPEDVTAAIGRRIAALLPALGLDPARVAGIGLVAPGPLDLDAGSVLGAPTLPGWHGYPVRGALADATGLPVLLDNDATAAAIGDSWGGDVADAVAHSTIYMGAGVGAGIVLGGTVFRGSSSNAGELGQMRMHLGEAPRGPSSEELAGPAAVAARARRAVAEGRRAGFALSADGDPFADFAAVASAAVKGDALAVELITESAEHLADAAIALANLLDLDSLSLAGPSFETAGSLYLQVVERRLDEGFFARARHRVRVQLSAHVADAAAVGGAALVLQQELSPRTLGLVPPARA
jgi:predicted NBD/HSP70 family sugar kinase